MNKVFIYIIDMDQYHDNLSLFWEYLSINEQEQAKRYYDKVLADHYIISHGILRSILSYYIDQSPSSLELINNTYGKPFLKNSNIEFNMSHSRNMVCYVIAFNNKIGVDIEFYNTTIDMIGMLELVFTKKEVELIRSLDIDEQYKTFYKFWTKKEALVKAVGKGLYYPINTIEVIKLLSGESILLTDGNKELRQEWYCYELDLPKDYSGAVGIQGKIDELIYLDATKL